MCETRNSSLLVKITVLVVICCCILPAQAKYGGGTGEPNNPYLIYTAQQINEIGLSVNQVDWDKHFLLCADIDLSNFTGTAFNIIGTNVGNAFTGVFDGNGHAIANFTYDSNDRTYIGLFGYVDDPNAEIKNLELIDPDVDAGTRNFVGSLVGWLRYGTITNCHAKNGSVAGNDSVGGLIGFNHGTITNCYSSGRVSGEQWIGGLVGYDTKGTITNCYSTGSVSGTTYIGVLVGYCQTPDSQIKQCFATGDVRGRVSIGGLVGLNYGRISNCFAKGDVSRTSGTGPIGGLIGSNLSPLVEYCYSCGSVETTGTTGGLIGAGLPTGVRYCFWDVNTSGLNHSAGGTGLPTELMQAQATYLAAGWDFVDETANGIEDIWKMPFSGYPILPSTKGVYGGGSGTEEDPYQIWDANHMQAIGADPCDWDKHFLLCADIDLSNYTGTSFNIIGYGESWNSPDANNKPFTGVFDGNGHTISNFTYDSNDRDCIGLFAYVGRRYGGYATIKDIGLINPNVNARTADCVGSLVGYLNEGSINRCFVEGGSVSGTGWDTGGLVGYNDENGIRNCYSTASVSGNKCVGGLVGENDWDEHRTIRFCYSTGSVTGNEGVGGLVGASMDGGVSVSFWDVNTSGQTTSDGGTPKTTAQMQTKSTFTDAWWDFVGEAANGTEDIWDICEGTNYPRLSWWQPVPGNFLCPEEVDFIDYSFFASHWAEDNCDASNDCEGTDLDKSGAVSYNDLGILVDNWLESSLLLTSKASNPSPADGAMGVSITADLSWIAGAGAISQDVYFGTSSPPPFITSQTLTTFDPGPMAYLTKYYWRINHTGTVWSFTTVMFPPPLP